MSTWWVYARANHVPTRQRDEVMNSLTFIVFIVMGRRVLEVFISNTVVV